MNVVIGEKIANDAQSLEDLEDRYVSLLRAVDIEGIAPRIEKMIEWIKGTDFFEAPASTRFHDCFPGGLVFHHIQVYNQCCDLIKMDKFRSVDINVISLLALTHDYCKIGLYEYYTRNVKNEDTGEWEKKPSYRWKEEGPAFPLGHGTASMYLVNKFVPLSIEASLAIRWHMGSYCCSEYERSELQDAIDEYPMVLMLQTADRLSYTNY